MLDLETNKKKVGLPFFKMKNNRKPKKFWGKVTNYVLLSVEYPWDVLKKLSRRQLELWIWCPEDT